MRAGHHLASWAARALALLLLLVPSFAPAGPAAPTTKPTSKPDRPLEPPTKPWPGGAELPPPPDDGGGEAGVDSDGDLSEEEKLERRLFEFNDHLARAQAAAEKERWDEAVREYSAALRLQPGDPTALLGRARARKAKSPPDRCPTRAISDLRLLETYDPRGAWIEQRQELVAWMGLCGSSHANERLDLARELAEEEYGAIGRPPEIRVVVAQLLVERSLDASVASDANALRNEALQQLERWRAECEKTGTVATADGLRLQADIYREVDALDKALTVYRELLKLHGTSLQARGVGKVIEELQVELDLRKLDKEAGWKPTDAAEAAYERGVQAMRAGDLVTAEAELSWAIGDSPWFPRAYAQRAVAYARTGRTMQAVDDLERATRMDRADYQAHMTLGLLYKHDFAGAEDDKAIEHLGAALRLRPDLHRLHLLLGELYARTDREKAREHYERFLRTADDDDSDAQKALRALRDLEREIRRDEQPAITPPTEESLRFLDPELQRFINEAYLRGTEHQDPEEAEKILLEALERFPQEPVVFNHLARVVYAQDRFGDARAYWERSLTLEEDQLEVHERLGLLLRADRPDDAIPHLQRAADLGSLTARYVLAEALWDQRRPLDASRELDRYLGEAGKYDMHWDPATALRAELDRVFLQFYLVAGIALVLAIAIPAWRVWRHYRGASLRQLLERDPKSFPEVARLLSLIRHEILKHNTAFLADVGRALEVDAPDAEARAAVLARRLFGEDRVGARSSRGRDDGPAGIHGRFLGYVAELEKVGRAHRVTLNLHRKDPIFRPMIAAFDELSRWAPELQSPHGLRSGRKLELAKVLAHTGHVLGRQAFDHLSGLIRELCIVSVDTKLVERVYTQVVGEEQFVGMPVAPLELHGSGAPIRIFRTDLEDILANVIRNSMRSSLLYARPPVGLGIDLATELDEITGLGTLAIRIKDRSPEQLSNEMLRGRYVERGMGITVDLLSRYDGSIAVEPEQAWAKAVVLRFFVLEDDATAAGLEAAA